MTGLAARASALALLLLQGCAHLAPPAEAEAVRACREWFRGLDQAVESAGVRDAQEARIERFPYLRVDRFHAALRDRASAGEPALQAWADALLQLDQRARGYEMRNLPGFLAAERAAVPRTFSCGRLLRELDLAKPELRAVLLESARVPDDYSPLARGLGLYPLTRLAFSSGVRRWEEEVRATFAAPLPPPAEGTTLIRYAPPAGPALSRLEVARLLSRAAEDPLGRPRLSERELLHLATTYAPSFEVAVRADYDRFGALRWRRGGATPEVNGAETVVYFAPAYTRYRRGTLDRMLLQLVYTIWFAERPPLEPADILAGRLDGVVWRVTLAPDGEPLVYDSMHACGCYHLFFPTPRATPLAAPDPRDEWAFIPRALPRVAEGERPRLRIASATHYVEAVEFVRGADSLVRYELRDYEELRSLQSMDGGFRSAFGADGLIAGTERAERFLFWPMGIASAGAMRQWGRHATAFVGRRHFDDADLLERRFDLDLEGRQ